jgi:hypothetical protein
MRANRIALLEHAIVRALVAAAVALAAPALAADDSAARLRLAALTEEGDLLLEESTGLAPIRERDRAEGERLGAAEKQLQADVSRIEKQVAAYNKAVADLGKAAAEHARACPGNIADSAVEQCNERGARLMDQAAELDRKHIALEKEQKQINARVARQNAARETWLSARRENGSKLDANAADTQRWVASARNFMTTRDFTALRDGAGKPSACAQLRLSDAGAHFGEAGLKRLLACLKAVQRGPQ